MKHATSVGLACWIALGLSCTSPQADNLRETYLDADYKTLEVIDVAVLKPVIGSKADAVLGGVMRTAARQYLLDTKAYSVVSDDVVDTAAAAGGVDATSDGPAAARALETADAVLQISVTEWDREWLVPRGAIYATGKVSVYARRDGRRLYETTFTRERLASPGRLNELNIGEAEKQMAMDLIRVSLAGLPKKLTR